MIAQIVISTLQRKVSELTLVNVMLEAQVKDLQTQLNSITEQQPSDAITDGNENQAQEIDNSDNSPDDF